MTSCGDCGLERPACKCGPRWIREALDAAGVPLMAVRPGWDVPMHQEVVKALIERLPLQALRSAIPECLNDIRDDFTSDVLKDVVAALTEDAEVVTLTELYQGASRALDKAGVPYAVRHTAPAGPDDDCEQFLDLPARIRWLADQRPTKLDLEREVNTVKAERDTAVKGRDLWERMSADQHGHIVRLKQENDALTERVNKMEDAVKAREDRIAALVQENEDLMAERSDMETEIEHLEDEMHADDAEGDL